MNILPIALLTIVISVCVLWIAGVLARRRFHGRIAREVRRLLSHAGKGVGPERFAALREQLPQPVRRYLQFALAGDSTTLRTMLLRHVGWFRTNPKQRWLPIKGEEYFTVGEPGFVWRATVRVAPLLWIEACDRLIDGRGNMLVKFRSIFTLVDASGTELDQGALLRWLAEVVWFPVGYVGDRIRWESIDSDSSRATLVHEGRSVTAIVEFDGEGKLVGLRGQRFRSVNGSTVLTPWKGLCSDYREFGGTRIPASVAVSWELPEGHFSYAKFQVTAIHPNVDTLPG